MRIAFIGQKGIPAISGGVEKHVQEAAVRLVKRGHQVLVYTRPNYTDKNMEQYQGVTLRSIPTIATKHLDAIAHTFFCVLDAAFRQKAEVVHFHSIGPSFWLWLAQLLMPRRVIVSTFHTQCYLHSKWNVLARLSLKVGEIVCCTMSDRCITVSKNLKKYVAEKYLRTADYIPNGVELMKKYETVDALEQWGLESGKYFLAVSRIVAHKGLHFLVHAYNRIDTDKKLVIVGDGAYTDDYVNELQALAVQNPNIIFTGRQSGDALGELFSHAYAFIQPSESEGLSIALLEAMAYGKGTLVSDIPENLEAVGKTGFVFHNANVSDLSQKLVWLEQYPKEVSEAGEDAKARVLQAYDWERIVDELESLYEQELAKHKIHQEKEVTEKRF